MELEPSDGLADPGLSAHRRTVAVNAGALFAGQALGLIAPLIVVPYLARVLGPAAWGPVLTVQALANWLIVILEFAFDLSGTRAVARSRVVADGMREIVQSVQSAKALLILAAVPPAALAAWLIPSLHAAPRLVVGGLAFAVFRGLSPLWYFQGVERVRAAVATESLSRVSASVAVFWLVQSPSHAWRVLALQAAFAAVSLALLTSRLFREVPFALPSLTVGWRTLREHFVVFACRASTGVYAQANALILGAINPATVAFFGGAERIVRAAVNLLTPVTQAIVPRMSALHLSDRETAERLTLQSFVIMGAIGTAMSVVAVVAAPLLVRILLGPAYGAAVPLLRILAALPILVAINTVLGLFWAVPFGRERGLLGAILAGGATNLILAALLVPRLGGTGMAIAATASEVTVFVVLISIYLRR